MGEVVTEVIAEMHANVWQVHVSPGDAVQEGETAVVLESMKMEIPVLSPCDGVVDVVTVQEGDPVHEGAVLFTLR